MSSVPSNLSRLLSRLGDWLATGFGAGHSPVAPGTAGSLVGLILFWPLQLLPLWVQLVISLALFALGVRVATALAARVGRKDPGLVVVDEILGQWVSLLALPLVPWTAAAGFVLFRVMDVLKPWPARDLERLPKGLGIMADDVAAGIYANLVLRLLLLLWPA
jgi:phosphatidylglycerophosphatase A